MPKFIIQFRLLAKRTRKPFTDWFTLTAFQFDSEEEALEKIISWQDSKTKPDLRKNESEYRVIPIKELAWKNIKKLDRE